MIFNLWKKIRIIGRNSVIFVIIISWIFSGWPPLDFELNLPPKLEQAQAQVQPLQADNKTIDFTFTDDNTDENLIIITDKQTYIGLARGEVYFSVTNIGNKAEAVNLQAYFPTDSGEVTQIAKWTQNVPYEVDVPKYSSIYYFCEEGWSTNVNIILILPIVFYMMKMIFVHNTKPSNKTNQVKRLGYKLCLPSG